LYITLLYKAPIIETRYYLGWIGEKLPFHKILKSLILMLCFLFNSLTFIGFQIYSSGMYGYLQLVGCILFSFFIVASKNNIGIVCNFYFFWFINDQLPLFSITLSRLLCLCFRLCWHFLRWSGIRVLLMGILSCMVLGTIWILFLKLSSMIFNS
jgi:hypothetical protein